MAAVSGTVVRSVGDGTAELFARPGALRTVRRYNAQGHIAGGRLLEIPADATTGFDAAFDDAFSDPEVVLVSVTMTRPSDVRWLYHGVGRYFPEEWERFRAGAPPEELSQEGLR